MAIDPRRLFGNKGEALAASFLKEKGYSILETQKRTPYGEIDLICECAGEIIFVEVKSRRSQVFGYPEEAVTRKKIQRMLRCAQSEIARQRWEQRPWRLDVIAIEYTEDPPVISHIEGIDIPGDSW